MFQRELIPIPCWTWVTLPKPVKYHTQDSSHLIWTGWIWRITGLGVSVRFQARIVRIREPAKFWLPSQDRRTGSLSGESMITTFGYCCWCWGWDWFVIGIDSSFAINVQIPYTPLQLEHKEQRDWKKNVIYLIHSAQMPDPGQTDGKLKSSIFGSRRLRPLLPWEM